MAGTCGICDALRHAGYVTQSNRGGAVVAVP